MYHSSIVMMMRLIIDSPHELLCLPFSTLHRVLVDAQREDFVDIFLVPEKVTRLLIHHTRVLWCQPIAYRV